VSFEADARSGQSVRLDAAFVHGRLDALVADEDLARYIL